MYSSNSDLLSHLQFESLELVGQQHDLNDETRDSSS